VFENRLVRKAFGSEREDVKEDWRKMHNKEHLVYSPQEI
jgi:hypothetical protein